MRSWLRLLTLLLFLPSQAHAASTSFSFTVVSSTPSDAVELAAKPSYRVLRIIDGDTIDVEMDAKKVRVRLLGVDTPETQPELKQRFGREATLFLRNVLKGEKVYLEYEPDQKVDRFGRTLAYVYRAPDGMFANLELVRQGYAQVFRKFDFKHKERFLAEETLAKAKGKGLWDPDLSSDLPAQPIAAPEAARPPPALTPTGQTELQATVYVTRTGAKYHRAGCRHLSRSQIPMPLNEARLRYTPCKVCRPP